MRKLSLPTVFVAVLGIVILTAGSAFGSWAQKSYNSNVTFRDALGDSLVSDGGGAYVTGQGGLGRFGDDPFGHGYDFYYFQTSQGRYFSVDLPGVLSGRCASGGTIYVKSTTDPFWFQPPGTVGLGVTTWGWADVECNVGGTDYDIWYGTPAASDQCLAMTTNDYTHWSFNAGACVGKVGVASAVGKVKGKIVYQTVADNLTATYGQSATVTGSVR